ncbi:hypothetical protein GCK32_012703 [Trichostrongylus colubriformis]|uniref:Uncharacterized protein n=1 Tax=Trichostrongylus colubriformis TaxID=6319 RepID=A0AAN8J195_TRICO
MYPAFVLCMAVQVYAYGRNQSPTTPEAVPAEKTAPPAAPAETPAPPAVPAKKPAPKPKAPLPPEEPGPGDFLDEFAKRLVGYTVKELQTSSDPYPLDDHRREPQELLKLNDIIIHMRGIWEENKYDVRFRSKYLLLYHMKAYLEDLQRRTYPRATVLKEMRDLWSRVDSDLQQELRSEFSAFELFA